jgi:hypothetical protein
VDLDLPLDVDTEIENRLDNEHQSVVVATPSLGGIKGPDADTALTQQGSKLLLFGDRRVSLDHVNRAPTSSLVLDSSSAALSI